MIISKLSGGLGNQLFQWAFAKSLQIKYDIDLVLDSSSLLQNIPGITKRSYELHKFPRLRPEKITESVNYFSGLVINDDTDISKLNYNSTNILLNGYFQHKKHISLYDNSLSNFLQPDIDSLNINSSILEKITTTNSVSIHVRRTDYLKSPGHHPVQSINYYNDAIDILKNYDNLFVFSDDINWCTNYLFYKNMHFIQPSDCVHDLWLMSLCKNNIIANSSFSWWASYLNSNKDKIVIAPKKWFGPLVSNNDSLAMDQWITID